MICLAGNVSTDVNNFTETLLAGQIVLIIFEFLFWTIK
jgi:hypothetical protein